MIRAGRILLLCAALGVATATAARAQSPGSPPARERDVPSPSEYTVQPPPVAPQALAPATPPTLTFAPALVPGPYFEVDPVLDRPPLPQPDWFTDADLEICTAHVKNHLGGQVQFPFEPGPDTVHTGGAPLDWTVFPRVEVGYRLPSAFGAISLSFRFLDTDGNGTTAGLDGPARLHSRLSLHEGGLDYSSAETSLWPNWDMKWTVGARLLYAFYDSRADESAAVAAAGSTIFEQRESSWYGAGGAHLGLELDRQIAGTGLAFVLRGEGQIYLGRLRQAFYESSTTGASASSTIPVSQGVPVIGFFAGARWQPPRWECVSFYLGYRYEYWWDLGKNNSTTSAADLEVQGLFLRAAWNF
jgi:hypothetical protein